MGENNYMIGKRVFNISIIVNVLLTIVKIIIGIIANSAALLADGIHSLSDVFTSIIGYIGIKISNKKPDSHHHYGYEKVEPIITIVMAMVLLLIGTVIGFEAVKKIILHSNIVVPKSIAIYGAVISIAIKEWMFRYTIKNAEKIQSTALMADAWHHRSDSISSIGALVGLIFAQLGYAILDPIASIIICIIIVKVAISIFIQAIKQLVDHACDPETEEKIREIILSTRGVKNIDILKTRIHASKLYVDIECSLDEDLSFKEAHNIAEQIHIQVEQKIKNVKHCMVHVSPS